uniref:MIF4G domain-containing protein n=1 Tax=viral metagenome TaxID=1070528 RepID=A0A6C0KHF5_9ZZZZ
MITTGSFYTLDAIQKIMMYEPPFSLPHAIVNLIRGLENEIDHVSLDKPAQPRLRKKTTGSNVRKMDEPWEAQPVLKATVLEVAKEGFEKQLSDIRIHLNKLSTKTYSNIRDKIMEEVTVILQNEEVAEKIAEFIFEVASSNKFYSELYSQLYKELVEKFPIFETVIYAFLDKYMDSIQGIIVVDQNKDYDAFCENNKTNEKRKATAVFIVNLLKNNVIPSEKVMSIIIALQNYATAYIEEEGKTGEVDEITENLFLFITMTSDALKREPLWISTIEPNIRTFASHKAKDKKSLSNRAVFKYMDIVEKFLK